MKVRTSAVLWLDETDRYVEVEADVKMPDLRVIADSYFDAPLDPGFVDVELIGDPETGDTWALDELDGYNQEKVMDAISESSAVL